MLASYNTDALHALCTKRGTGLLDAIDALRSQGISHYVSLPQLIVCGDQSSGKSSVLEAISGIPFPARDNMCNSTSSIAPGITVSIVPGENRSETERQALAGFHEPLTDIEGLPHLIEQAKTAMGMEEMTNAFAEDVLRVEISGPDRPHLTIVDLPGLIHTENRLQTAADVKLVQQMVRSYMENRRSIILAVVSANNDYANQIVLELARKVDEKGHRTLGIITKPDLLPAGSASEEAFADLARNKDVEFRLGWHVLRNRDYDNKDASLDIRAVMEEEFFSRGIWGDFPRHAVGIASLRIRLSRVLLDQIQKELPDLVAEIERSTQETRGALERLGSPRGNLDEQHLFLLKVSQSFQLLVKAAVDGAYGDTFFEYSTTEDGHSRRLRAVIQNLNTEFAEGMRLRGHRRNFVDAAKPNKITPGSEKGPVTVSRASVLDEIAEILKRTRGRELPGTHDPLIIGDLFFDQASPWLSLTEHHLLAVWSATRSFLDISISYLTDEITAGLLLDEVIGPEMDEVWTGLQAKHQELLRPYQKGAHPITYNHYFTETLQTMRNRRIEEEVGRKLSTFLHLNGITTLEDLPPRKIKTATLITALSQSNEADMNRYASSELLDCMLAFYQVALKSVVDNIAIYAVEYGLIQKLEGFFSTSRVMKMSPELIQTIAAEPPGAVAQREQLSRKLEVLNGGIETCRRYLSSGTRFAPESRTPEDTASDHEATLRYAPRS
ncbi:dynamin family protein [Xylariales sp. PMI_506]|nr:dynamin family protein [Xylariales sp. PMI_506]